ncbi:MAG: hypothetical protein KA354_16045 [Phycisphaerae bacterium]|nr:hypothetical protein [Phycisphaerae bacterium]
MRRYLVSMGVVLGAILCLGPASWATQVTVNGVTSLFDDYEVPDALGLPPVANIGTWTVRGGTVQEVAPPGAYQGSQFLAMFSANSPLMHRLDPVGSGTGTVIRLDTMVFLPPAAQGQEAWYQMVWYNTSGTTVGADNSPIHTAIIGDQLCYYEGGSAYATTGVPVAYGVWQHWVIEYTVGSGQFTATIDGASMTMGLNARSSDVGIGYIQFFANSVAGSNPILFDAAVSQGTNDACGNAFTLSSGTTPGTTVGATPDGTASCGNSNGSPDVWYAYTATCNGQLTIDSCGSGFDTVVSIHADGCPASAATELAGGCSDDCMGTPCGGTASCVTIAVTNGTRYRVRVAGKGGASGAFTLNTSVVCESECPAFPQNFDTNDVGSTACWFGGQRWFDPTPGATVAVTDTDFVSFPRSLMVTGSGTTMMAWRAYETVSSNGTDPISVSFDFKVNNFADNIAFSPFAFNKGLWGAAGTPHADAFGWPVNTNYEPTGLFSYIDAVAGSITMFAKDRADLNGQWIRWEGTLYPATRKADVVVEVMTGPAAGTSGGVIGKDFQWDVANDYYGQAMDEIRGSVFFTPGGSTFGPDDQVLIDNYDVRVGPPATPTLPVNDLCADALTIGNGKIYGRTLGATPDGDASCGNTSGSPDVWYRYTATCTGDLIIRGCSSGFDTVVSVHSDTCPGTAANQLASGCAQGCATGLCDQFQPCLSVPVVESTSYLIRVAGVDGQSGFFGLDIFCFAPILNDTCESATVMAEGMVSGTTLMAAVDGDASCGSSGSSPDVFYAFTPATTGTYTISVCPKSAFTPVLSIHSGCPAALGNELTCTSGPAGASLVLSLTASAKCIIRVSGENGTSGDFDLSVVAGGGLAALPLNQGFESDTVGAAGGWETGYPTITSSACGDSTVTVIDTEASPNDGGSRSLHWLEPAGDGRSALVRRWEPLPSAATGKLRVAYDFKIVQHSVSGLSFIVSGWEPNGALNLNLFAMRFDPDTGDGLSIGMNYLNNGNWENFMPVADTAEIIGQWFHYEAIIDVGARTVDLTLTRLMTPAPLSAHIVGSFQTTPGENPLDADIANYHGIDIFQSSGAAISEVLVDNVTAEVLGGCPRPFADADGDSDVDQVDFGVFQACFTGAEGGVADACKCLDWNKDNAIGGADLNKFSACFSGPAIQADPSCAD